jgi:cyclohexyl-isocyanide hydratase
MDRRAFTQAALAGVAAAGARPAAAQTGGFQAGAPAGGEPFRIGMIVFERMTNLDFVGPHDLLARVPQAQIYTLGKTLKPMLSDARTIIVADTLLKDAPELDMIFIGGGAGTTTLMEDKEVLDWLRERAPRAKWITSVCTGALVLGAAGLLRGYKAATHWTAMDILPILGAIPVHERVVVDRNRISGGGVTAGIDFGLVTIAQLWGQELAETIQLGNEYDPQPPFQSGNPRTASKAALANVHRMMDNMTRVRGEAAKRMAAQFRG